MTESDSREQPFADGALPLPVARAPGDSCPTSTVRGTVIKLPDASAGLLVAKGVQYAFHLASVWQSPTAPALDQLVDVSIDHAGTVVGITVVSSPSPRGLAPLSAPFSRRPLARLAYAAPLAFVVLIGFDVLRLWFSLREGAEQLNEVGRPLHGSEPSFFDGLAQGAAKAMGSAITLNFGFYVVVLSAVVVATAALRRPPVPAGPRPAPR